MDADAPEHGGGALPRENPEAGPVGGGDGYTLPVGTGAGAGRDAVSAHQGDCFRHSPALRSWPSFPRDVGALGVCVCVCVRARACVCV